MKRFIILAAGVSVLLVSVMIAWLLGSSRGNEALLRLAVGDILEVGTFKGSLWSDVQLDNLKYHDDQQQLTIKRLQLRWQPSALFNRLLHVENLQADGIEYQSSGQDDSNEALSPPTLPLAIQFDQVSLADIKTTQQDNDTQISRIAFRAHSLDNTIRLADIDVRYQQQQLNANSDITLQQDFPFTANIAWQGQLPEVGSASGSAELNGDLNTIAAKLVIKTPARLTAQGSLSLQESTPSLSLQGDWDQLQWPFNTSATIISETGQFTLGGPLNNMSVTLSSVLQLPQQTVPAMQSEFSGQLTSDGFDNLKLVLQSARSKLTAEGKLLWTPALTWDLSVNGKGIDPSEIIADLPGNINLTAQVKGGIDKDNKLWLDTDLQQLDGSMHGYPLKASGQAKYSSNHVAIRSLNIFSGPNNLELNGGISEQLDLKYTINAPNLAASWPALGGELFANGQLTGKAADPEITSQINATGLVYQQHRADRVEANLTWQKAMADGQILISDFTAAEYDGKSLSIQLSGTPQSHDLQIALQADELQLDASAKGNWQSPQWQGQFQKLHINQPTIGQWRNSDPVFLEASSNQLMLEDSCFLNNDARLCTALQWQAANSNIKATLTDLPLQNLLQPLAPQAEIDGSINGELELSGPLDTLQGTARLALPRGQITLETDEDYVLPLTLQDGAMDVSLKPDGNSATLKLKAGQADITAQLSSGPFSKDAAIPVNGELQARIPELSQISRFIPGLADAKGSLQAQASVTGTVQEPVIEGLLELQQASANIPQLGLRLENAKLTAKNQDYNNIVFQGEVNSGEGKLSLNGSTLLDQSKNWPTQLKLTGQNVQIARLPEAQVTASPDLEIRVEKQKLDIKGQVAIPKASIELIELPRQAVTVSEDEVIIGEQQATENNTYSAINTNIDISLGQQVSFKGFGLNTRIEGDVNLYSREGKNLAQGQLTLKEGKYKAYAQDLTIEKGQLLFNGPPQNPGLDIKATRVSQDKEVTAILNVSGSLQKPLVTVSSTPYLPEEEALSYLLTGRGLDDKGPDKITMLRMAAASKGLDKSQDILDRIASDTGLDDIDIQEGETLEDTSLLLGKYLSPDLYVSYAVGLFDNQGALLTRYRLNKRLRLEVQSGTAQSMDLIYSVEK